ncbi:metallophosphoesterase family protein [Methanobrevibacter curvatus]|uniref:DNA double-strand break repair protein Mre11 n=1 Tax=Methanobrevibacter curvatus TaxID=49547 RepID=A0A166AFE5_9EURY|nr:exonuclease SbcCD subunit D [Methanobrevibacter curvatus]KZX11961.1 nuclease SbcCD subunit D [Methanobrevibacter curvatus]
MKFAHFADTHLGYRQYSLEQREEDFYYVFNEIIDKIIEERVDFVIHSGDLFDNSRPHPRSLLVFQEAMHKLNNANIPIYVIAGNHDIVMRKNSMPPQVLYKKMGLKLFSPNKSYFVKDDVFIGGIPYLSKAYNKLLISQLKSISNESKNYNKSILMLHQGIDKYLPFEYELELNELPLNFNYYGLGHIHSRITEEFGDGILSYSGSTEIYKTSELGDFRHNGKGFNLVDLDGDIPNVEKINVKPRREFLIENIDYSKFDSEISQLKNNLSKLNEKPMLNLTVSNGNFNRADIFEVLNKTLSNLTINLRPDFEELQLRGEEDNILISDEPLNPKFLIRERLEEYGNEDLTTLAIDLLDNLSQNKVDEANRLADKFYNEYYEIDIE